MGNTVKLRPIGDDLLIHPFEDPSETETGRLHIPESAKQRVDQGIVIAKGPLVTSEIEIGDHVLFSGYTGDKISVASAGQFFVIPEQFIKAIVQESSIVLMDTETVKRILSERRGELMQRFSDDIEATKLTRSIFDSIFDRITTITRAEGFEF